MVDNKDHGNARRRRFLKSSGAVVLGSAGLAGCLGGGGGNGGATTTMDQDLSLEERAQEEGEVKVAAPADPLNFNEKFEDEYGISVNYQNVDAGKIATRVLQEHNANKQTYDVTSWVNVGHHISLADQGVYREIPEETRQMTNTYYDNMIPVKVVRVFLAWLYNSDIVDTPPGTWSEMVSGDYRVTLDTEEPELIVAFEEMYGLEEAKQMIRDVADVAVMQTSHTDAGRTVLQGENHMGILIYDDLYEEGKYGIIKPLHHENAMTHKGKEIPIIALADYMPLVANSPHPNAAELYLRYNIEEFGTTLNAAYKENVDGDFDWYPPYVGPGFADEHDDVMLIAFDKAPKLQEYYDLFQELAGIQ